MAPKKRRKEEEDWEEEPVQEDPEEDFEDEDEDFDASLEDLEEDDDEDENEAEDDSFLDEEELEEMDACRIFQEEAQEILEHLTMDEVREVLKERGFDPEHAPRLRQLLREVIDEGEVSSWEEAWDAALEALEDEI